MSCKHSLEWGLVVYLNGITLDVVGYSLGAFMLGSLVGVCLRD